MSKNRKSVKRKKAINKTAVIIAVILFIVGIISGIVATVATVAGNKQRYEFTGEIAKGIDVSHHNGKIDWSKAKNEIDFAFVRVGYRGYANGKMLLDKQYKRNLKNANANNVPVGVYFYSQATTPEEAEEEAKLALKAIRKYDISLPVVIDFEYASLKNGRLGGRLFEANLTKKQATKIINAFCDKVKQAGYEPACYASTYFYKSVIDTKHLNDDICIWVADYNHEITYSGDYDIWQYSQNGKCKGVKSEYVDLNYWYIKK